MRKKRENRKLLVRIFHTGSSRRRKEADTPGRRLNPPPYVGGYKLFRFQARYEISGLVIFGKEGITVLFAEFVGRGGAGDAGIPIERGAGSDFLWRDVLPGVPAR